MRLTLEKYLSEKSVWEKKKATAHITSDFWLDPKIQVVFRKHRSSAGAYESSPLHSCNLKKVSCAKLEDGSNFYQHQIAPGPFCLCLLFPTGHL